MSVTIRKAVNGYVVVSQAAHGPAFLGDAVQNLAARQLGRYGDGQERVYSTFDEAVEFMRTCFEPSNPYAASALMGHSRLGEKAPVEQPQSPDPQSSERESTETMVEGQVTKEEAEAAYRAAIAEGKLANHVHGTIARALTNGTAHPEQQD